MNEEKIRKELYSFYLRSDAERSRQFAEKCFKIMDGRYRYGMSVTEQKLLQYDVITEQFEPVLFKNVPYFYETGALTSLSDGARWAKGYSFTQANGWVYQRNEHLFIEQDRQLWNKRCAQGDELLYLICGPYNDVAQHFNFNSARILQIGLKGVYTQATDLLSKAENNEEREFLEAVRHGMCALKRMAEKFAERAQVMLETEQSREAREGLALIAEAARRIPWEPPKSFYEGLAALAFLRTAVGTLEGVGLNTFGRLDKDLINLYDSDIKSGAVTQEQAYELICKFLLIWDCHYDHDMPMEGYADHELENTYVIGGCDDDGKPLYNDITKMLLTATDELKIIFPKVKCRYSKNSPREYLEKICRPILNGTSVVLLQNDDSTIPALLNAGRELDEARDYLVTGCWGLTVSGEKFDHGSYLNLLKPFEISWHNLTEKEDITGIRFERFENCKSFEELYQKTLRNCEILIDERLRVTKKGGRIFGAVDRLPVFSSVLDNCLEKRKDFTVGGAKYSDDHLLMFGLPNIVDSLLAVKALVYDEKKYTLDEIIKAVRSDWNGYENMRLEAMHKHGWGDGSEEACSLASRFNGDLADICRKKTGTYGGKVNMGHLTYTEIMWWGKSTLATPDGRKNGDYFAQGLTPSRLKRIPNVTDFVYSMSRLDPATMAANSVVNIILPQGTELGVCVDFLRAVSETAVQSLQLNCTSKEELSDAQRHPEKYPNLIVRVTGFSAKFTSLSAEWQNEVISRNFYS